MSYNHRVLIDSAALANNVSTLIEHSRGAELMAVVKANAYGHGLLECARIARSAGAPWLGVAQFNEALALRSDGDSGRLFAWLAVPSDPFDQVVAAGVDLGLSAEWALVKAAEASRLTNSVANVHLKIDTGLGRAGATRADWESLVALALGFQAEGTITISGIWSHFALADAPGDMTISNQLEAFEDAIAVAKRMGVGEVLCHIANSAATLSLPGARFDLVRPGIALYGISPGPLVGTAQQFGLKPVMSVRSELSLVKQVPPMTGLSYGHEYRTTSEANVAVVPMGYADGIPRNATNRGPIWCAGTRTTVAGRVCMDQFMVDLGANEATAGDEVVIFGSGENGEPTANEWAEATETIPYEIVTRISPRTPREFL